MTWLLLPVLAEMGSDRLIELERRLSNPSGLALSAFFVVIGLGLVADASLLVFWRTRPYGLRRHLNWMIWRPWSGRDAACLVALLGLAQVVMLFAGDAIRSAVEYAGFDGDRGLMLAQTLGLQMVGIAAVAWMIQRNRVSWGSAFGLEPGRLWKGIALGLFALLALAPPMLFYTGLYRFFLHLIGVPLEHQGILNVMTEENVWWMRLFFVALAAVIAPLFEEVFFRGILLPVLAQRFRADLAVVMVSTVFALVHWNTAAFVPLFILSVGFCMAYLQSESLWTPIVMHAVFNLTTLTLVFSAA